LLGLNLSLKTILDLRAFITNSKSPKLPLPVFNAFLNKIVDVFKNKYCNEKEKTVIDNFIRETYLSIKNVF